MMDCARDMRLFKVHEGAAHSLLSCFAARLRRAVKDDGGFQRPLGSDRFPAQP